MTSVDLLTFPTITAHRMEVMRYCHERRGSTCNCCPSSFSSLVTSSMNDTKLVNKVDICKPRNIACDNVCHTHHTNTNIIPHSHAPRVAHSLPWLLLYHVQHHHQHHLTKKFHLMHRQQQHQLYRNATKWGAQTRSLTEVQPKPWCICLFDIPM
jgi:hypothetical protein